MAQTVEWLAEKLYEGMQKSATKHTGSPLRSEAWKDIGPTHQAMVTEALTAALDALGDPCLLKLREGEPIFTLRAQDQVAPAAIEDWWRRAVQAGMPHTGDKAMRSGLKISAFKAWQHEHADAVKVPD